MLNRSRSFIRSAAFAIAALSSLTASAQSANFASLTIKPEMVRQDVTREEWDGFVSRARFKMTDQRVIAWSTGNSRWEYSDGSATPVWAALLSPTTVSLDAAYGAGGTIALSGSETAVGITNSTTNGTGDLTLTASGVVSGANTQSVLSVTQSAGNTTSGTVRLANFNFSGTAGSGTAEGLRIAMPTSTDAAIKITKGSIVLDEGGITQTSGGITYTAGDITLTDGKLDLTDLVAEGAVLVTSAATTHNVVSATANSVTTGNLLYLESSAAGFNYAGGGRTISVSDGAAEVFDVGIDGRVHVAGTGATSAILVDAGNLVLTSGSVTLTSGNETLTAGDLTLTAGLLTIAPSASTTRGLTLNASGARNVELVDINFTGAFTANGIDIDATAAHSGNVLDITTSSTGSGSLVDLNVGAALYTGDVINIALGATSTAGQALVITGGSAARGNGLVDITDATTGNGAGILVTTTGSGASAYGINVVAGAGFVSYPVYIETSSADVTSRGLVIESGARAFTGTQFQVNATSGNASGAYSLWTVGTAGAATTTNHVFDVNIGAGDWRGNVLDVALGATATLGKVVNVAAGAAARSVDLFAVDDDGTSTGKVFAVTKSAGSGDGYYVTFDGAGTGNGVSVAMASNVAGTGIAVTTAATTGVGLSVASTGVLASAAAVRFVAQITASGAWDADTTNPTYVLDVNQNTGAGAAGDYALHVKATGTNVEGLHVDAGTSQFDETATVGISGTGAGSDSAVKVYASPGAAALYIDATTAGDRPTHTNGVIDLNVTTATASTVTLDVSTTTSGDRDAVVGINSALVSGGLTTAAKTNSAFKATVTGTGTDAGSIDGFLAAFASVAAGSTANGLRVTGTHDYTVTTYDTSMVVQPVTTSAGVGQTALFAAGDALTAGAGGALTVRAGDQAGGASNGGALAMRAGTGTGATGGAVTLDSGEGTTEGTLRLGIGSGADNTLLMNVAASAGGFSGINTVAMAGTARPTGVRHVQVGSLVPITGCTAGVFGQVGTRDMADAALNECAFTLPLDSNVDDTADIVVGIIWTSEAGADTTVAVWDVEYACVADNAQTDTAFTSIGAANDTLTLSDEEERVEFTVPNAAYAAGDICHISVQRQASDVADTVSQIVEILDVYYRYRSKTPN